MFRVNDQENNFREGGGMYILLINVGMLKLYFSISRFENFFFEITFAYLP